MGFRFWRRVRIAPGVTLNLSKSGGSLSFGPRGANLTIGPRGKRVTLGLPGTGMYYTTTSPAAGSGKRRASGATAAFPPPAPTVRPEDRLTMGFFKRIVTPDDEEALVAGCREFVLGNDEKAFEHLRRSLHLADAAYLAGFLALKTGRLEEAADALASASAKEAGLGRYFSKYGISAVVSLAITDEVTAHVGPDLRGVLLGLVEVYQRMGRRQDAIVCLERLRQIEPDDVVVRLSLAELLLKEETRPKPAAIPSVPARQDALQTVVRLAEGIENETPVHAALLLYKAKALRGLGLPSAALETVNAVLRKTQKRPLDLLRALRYERGLIYETLGRHGRARSEFERLYAEAPDYEDVAKRLGL